VASSIAPLILVAVVLAIFAYVFIDMERRRRSMLLLASAAAASTVRYVCPVTVRMRRGSHHWTDLMTGIGPSAELLVRDGFVEVGFTPGFHRFTAQLGSFWNVWRIENTTMHLERVGWIGSAILSRDSIVLTNERDAGVSMQLAVATAHLDELWHALEIAGAKPVPQA
jgi:hypothetical protein